MPLLDRVRQPQGERPPEKKQTATTRESTRRRGSKDRPEQEQGSSGDRNRQRRAAQYQELKSLIHTRLFDHIDLGRMAKASEERVSADIAEVTRRILAEEDVLLNAEEKQKVVEEIQHEVFGLGPLEPLLADPTVCDILVNRYDQIYIEREGKLEPSAARFSDDAHLMRIIERILSAVGRRIDESTPLVDARLLDGSRVNVIIPPLALVACLLF